MVLDEITDNSRMIAARTLVLSVQALFDTRLAEVVATRCDHARREWVEADRAANLVVDGSHLRAMVR